MAKIADYLKPPKARKDEAEKLKQLNEYFREAEFAMSARREKWKKHFKYWINKNMTHRPAYKSNLRVNYCFVITQVKIPVMTQNRPVVSFISYDKGEQAEASADIYSKLVGNALWNKLKMQKKLSNNCWNSSIYDIAWWKIGWDPGADGGIGEVFVSAVDPFKILPDPHASDRDSLRYIIHMEPYSVSELKAQYPKFADRIKPDKQISSILYEERKWEDRDPSAGGIVDGETKFAVQRAYKKEFWITAKGCWEMEDDDKGVPKMKYPDGKVVVMIGDFIVDEFPHPYSHGELPFVPQIMNEVGNDLYGMGDIEQIIPMQDGLNHAYQQIDDIVTTTANLGYTAHPDLGIENIRKLKKDLGVPGAIKVVPPELFKQDEAPQIPAYLMKRIEDLVQRIMDVSGVNEILMGSGRVTHRTFRGIERLFEAGTSRIGKSIQHMEGTVRGVAFQMGEIVKQFYTEPRVFTIIGGEGQLAGTLDILPADLQSKMEASVDSGATLPRDKQSRADLVFNLLSNQVFQMALAPDPAAKQVAKIVLDAVEFPGRESLLMGGAALGGEMPPQTQPQTGAPPPQLGPPPMPTEVEEMAAAAGMSVDELLATINQLQV